MPDFLRSYTIIYVRKSSAKSWHPQFFLVFEAWGDHNYILQFQADHLQRKPGWHNWLARETFIKASELVEVYLKVEGSSPSSGAKHFCSLE